MPLRKARAPPRGMPSCHPYNATPARRTLRCGIGAGLQHPDPPRPWNRGRGPRLPARRMDGRGGRARRHVNCRTPSTRRACAACVPRCGVSAGSLPPGTFYDASTGHPGLQTRWGDKRPAGGQPQKDGYRYLCPARHRPQSITHRATTGAHPRATAGSYLISAF